MPVLIHTVAALFCLAASSPTRHVIVNLKHSGSKCLFAKSVHVVRCVFALYEHTCATRRFLIMSSEQARMANVTCPQLLLLSPRVGDTYVDNVRNQACMSNSTCRHFLQQCVADTNENRNENSAQYRSHLDCINSFDQCVRPCVTRADITYATKAWCDGLLKLSQLYSDDDAQHAADGFVRDAYGPASGDSVVLFKPTLATGQDASRYRTQHDEIARYFAGSDGEMQGDGFARKNRWNSCEPRVYASRKDGCVAIALGSVTLNGHDADGKPVRVKVDKTWSFVPSADDPRRLQIVSHHSSLQV